MDQTEKIEKMKTYIAKQRLLNIDTLEFALYRKSGKIKVKKYNYRGGNGEAFIPDFVDEIKCEEDSYMGELDELSIFNGAENSIHTIIRLKPLQGSLAYLFSHFAVRKLNLSSFNTKNIKNMSHMFHGCSSKEIVLDGLFSTKNVTDMSGMFIGVKTGKLSLRALDTSNVTTMEEMFRCTEIESIDLGGKFTTKNVNDMDGMFSECKTESLKLGDNFDTSNVSSMLQMFESAEIGTLYLGKNFDVTHVDTSYMFVRAEIGQIVVSKDMPIESYTKLLEEADTKITRV